MLSFFSDNQYDNDIHITTVVIPIWYDNPYVFDNRYIVILSHSSATICKWVNDKETQVVIRLSAKNADNILAGKDPLPLRSKGYWEKRQKEDPVLNKIARCLAKGIKPASTRANGWPEARRYLLPANGVYLRGGVLMSSSVQPFSDTERFVVPRSAWPSYP